ncbi:hypothetical protein RZ616_002796 [Citrobacter braakii]|nr:hypothetical protein [Citrobacter braakii]
MLDLLNGMIEAAPIPGAEMPKYQVIDLERFYFYSSCFMESGYCQLIYFHRGFWHQKQPKKGDKIEVDHKCLFSMGDE